MLISGRVGVAALTCLLLAQPAAPAPAAGTVSGAVARGPHSPSRKLSRRLRRPNSITPDTCTVDSTDSFVGVGSDQGNYSGEIGAAVLAGYDNEACDSRSSIGTGEYNLIANGGDATDSFVGAGAYNNVSSSGAFIGAGGNTFLNAQGGYGVPSVYSNIVSGQDSFVGAGDLNQVSGPGSFIGAGGSAYAASGETSAANQVSGTDSFIGAGDQNSTSGSASFVGAGKLNTINGQGSFIGAGGYLSSTTTAVANYIIGTDAFIGAGDANYITANDAFIGGGLGNRITSGTYAAIAGGDGNTASGAYGAVAGGLHNNATATAATVGGGSTSAATGAYATIPGGYLNAAGGIGSFAAGTQAKARHNGAFVWSDNNGSAELQSTAPYQFVARASGGFFLFTDATAKTGVKLNPGSGAWASLSDRTMKTGVTVLDDAAVLAKVAALPVSEWSYISEHGVRHVGPMAQDFYAAFRVGEDDRHITSIDEDGVALAAIKALHSENRSLRERLTRDDARLAELERKVEALADR